MKRFSTKSVAFVGVFAALHVILYFMSFGLWRNWSIYLTPIAGVVLGPWAGFSAALIGSILARAIKPIDVWMFGIVAEPLAALAAGFLAKRQWKPVIAVYAAMLVPYFLHPVGRWLPLWTILDLLFALVMVYPAARLAGNLFTDKTRLLPVSLVLVSFVAVATDALARVLLLVPVGLSSIITDSPEVVYAIFVAGAVDSYIEDILVVIVTLVVGVPLLLVLRRILHLRQPLT